MWIRIIDDDDLIKEGKFNKYISYIVCIFSFVICYGRINMVLWYCGKINKWNKVKVFFLGLRFCRNML